MNIFVPIIMPPSQYKQLYYFRANYLRWWGKTMPTKIEVMQQGAPMQEEQVWMEEKETIEKNKWIFF